MLKIWHDQAWDDYLWWQKVDKQKLRRINRLIKEVERGNPIGKAERLRHSESGVCSCRIDGSDRLVYKVDDEGLIILSCKGHYD